LPPQEYGRAWTPVIDSAVGVTDVEDAQSTPAGNTVRVAARAMVVLQADGE
jgi:isoamylase